MCISGIYTHTVHSQIDADFAHFETVAEFLCVFPRLSASSRIAHLLPEEQVYLNQQSGTIRLDCFTHCLIVKCAPDITVS